MKDIIPRIVQGVELFLMALAVFLILFFFILWSKGAFRGDRISKIGEILRGEDILVREGRLSEEELDRLNKELKEKEKAITEESQRKDEEFKQKELDLEMANSVLSVIKKDIEEREAKVKEKEAKLGAIPKISPEEERMKVETNLAIFNKMETTDIISIIKDWKEEDIKKYLSQLKPSKASEIVSTLSKDNTYSRAKLNKILGESK